MPFYDEMAEIVQEMLAPEEEDGLGQGTVLLKRITIGPPPNEWTPGEETVTTWPLKAAVKRQHQRYENGVLIVETGDMVTFAVPAVVPQLVGENEDGTTFTFLIVIDGADRAITNVTPVPAAGTTVAWKAWCAA